MKSAAIVLAVLATTFARESAAQLVYTRPHDVLVTAIRTGHAEGVLQGQVADKFTQQFKSNGQLLVTADVIQAFPRSDCKRLRMVMTKKDVLSKNGPRDLALETKLNYCLDGRPPTELDKKQ